MTGYIERLRGAIQIASDSDFGDSNRELRIVTIRLDDAEALLAALTAALSRDEGK